jgi:RHS repeat-associated protein
VTRYLVDDLNPTGYAQVVEEVVSSTVNRVYTYGLQRISENQVISNVRTPSFYNYDGAGSVRQLTNLAGAATDAYDYDAFGNLISQTGTTPNNYLYRGEQYDSDLELYYLRARYYNPLTGHFMSRDPDGGKPIDPATLHTYLYADGDPIDGMDPTGRSDLTDRVLLNAAVISAVITQVTIPVNIAKFGEGVCFVGQFLHYIIDAVEARSHKDLPLNIGFFAALASSYCESLGY